MIIRAIHLVIFFCCLFVGMPSHATECAGGTKTILEISNIGMPVTLHHDRSIGKSRFVLRSQSTGKPLFSAVYDGRWFCFGFNKNNQKYIVGGVFERGSWLPLTSIQYLREDGTALEPSVFDRMGYLAMSSQTDAKNRYIAFVGGKDYTTGMLFVLNIENDTVKKLGIAPAPPPQTAETIDICKDEPFDWGSCWVASYLELDKGIIRFKPKDILEVSYGSDSFYARSEKRQVKRFKLMPSTKDVSQLGRSL